MRCFIIALMMCLSSAASANDGSYQAADLVEITQPVENAPEGVREGYWLVALGGDDLADGYRIEPSAGAGDTVVIVGATETNASVPVTLELVKRFGGQVVASASLMEEQSFAAWVVEAPFYLRVSVAEGTETIEFLVGIRIIPKSESPDPSA